MPFHPIRTLLLATAPFLLGGTAQAPSILYTDATAAVGVEFHHDNGVSEDKHLPETMGAGAAWLDYDNDGRSDLYLVQSGRLPGTAAYDAATQPGNRMYRGAGGRLAEAPAGAEDRGYGMGITVGDYDNDGWGDLFVTNFGPNALYRNNGDGTFSAVIAGVEDPRWSVSAAWGDLDNDGDLDLYVTHYVAYDPVTAVRCGEQVSAIVSYCHIDLFDGVADSLYRNDGDGTFTDVAPQAGVANARDGKGLGVVMGDLNGDGRTDIYVANDTQQNFLYLNLGDLRFQDDGLISGTGYSQDGDAQAGMGTSLVDLDGDLTDEILVANFSFEANNLYRQVAPGMYLDDTFAMGLGEPGLVTLSFGIAAFDADGDGDREVAVANGHILDNVDRVLDGTKYAQPNHLFRNGLVEQRRAAIAAGALDGDWRPRERLLTEIGAAAGSGFAAVDVSRGLAVGDLDGDGRPDLVFTNSGGPTRVLRNETPGGRRLVLRLRGRRSARDAFGARVTVTPLGQDPGGGAVGFPQVAEVRSSASYCSQDTSDLLFGLGSGTSARVTVRWLGGGEQTFELPAGTLTLIRQGAEEPIATALAR